MKKNQGFTLIELVVVIVILGILAATAAPKFIDLTSDATVAKLQGMLGAIRSGTNMVHAKAIVQNKTSDDDSITIGDVTIDIRSGYPTGQWSNSLKYVVNLDNLAFTSDADEICEDEWCARGNQQSIPSGITTSGRGTIAKIYSNGYSFNDLCGVYFVNYADGREPVIGLESADC
jgi:prepilin-type N-terminal cleavage/methylation domain-containing protein